MNTNDDAFDEGKQALRDIKATLRADAEDGVAELHVAASHVVTDDHAAAIDAAGTSSTVEEDIARRADAATATAVLDAVADIDGVDADSSIVETWRDRIEGYVAAQPLPALAIAAGAGVLIGLLLRGPRR